MLKRLKKQFGKLRDIPVEMRITRMWDAGEIQEFSDATMLDRPDKFPLFICDGMLCVENVIAAFPMPLGVAEHFKVNGREIPAVPMVTEERTVIAAASKSAKFCDERGFLVEFGDHIVNGQVLLEIPEPSYSNSAPRTETILIRERVEILQSLKKATDVFCRHGGGVLGFTPRAFCNDAGYFVCITVHVNPGEAMGARGVTKIAKSLGKVLRERYDWKPRAWICLNDSPHQTISTQAFWPLQEAFTEDQAEAVIRNARWASSDPQRAVTHNKGIMNAIDAIGHATAQDTRALEAGAWADAYRSGFCKPLSHFWKVDGGIRGELKMQLTVGTVGGATIHPFAQFSRRLMGVETSADLMCVMGAVGLAQNFAALAWALDT